MLSVCIHTHTYVHTYTCIYIHTHTHIHIYECFFSGTVTLTCKAKFPNLAFKLTRLECCVCMCVCVSLGIILSLNCCVGMRFFFLLSHFKTAHTNQAGTANFLVYNSLFVLLERQEGNNVPFLISFICIN